MATATTVRLPEELDERLAAYCTRTGAVKNRVVVLALRSYLEEPGVPALPVARSFEPDELPAREQAILEEFRDGLDAREVEA